LIAYKSDKNHRHNSATLRDVWLSAGAFYNFLQRWHDAFEAEWIAMPKISGEVRDDGAGSTDR
jgi:hypothetical protein